MLLANCNEKIWFTLNYLDMNQNWKIKIFTSESITEGFLLSDE